MKLMNCRITMPAALAAAVLMASCANPSHLVVYQHSNLGMNAGMSPATNNFHVRIGLRREFAAVVPKYYELKRNQAGEIEHDENGNPVLVNEAASGFIAGRMRVVSPWNPPEVTECIATGTAAINAAKGNGLPKFITDLKNPEDS